MTTKLNDIRRQIASLDQERAALQAATLPADEIRAAVRSYLDDFSEDPLYSLQQLAQPAGLTTIEQPDATRLLLGLFRPELDKRLVKYLIDTNPAAGLPAAERSARIAELQAQRRELEVAEELEILRLEDRGELVERRSDCDGHLVADVWHEHLDADGRLRTEEAA
jgi:hypothetical protein